MPRRHHRLRLATRHPLPVSVPQLLLRQLLLLAAVALAYTRIPADSRKATAEDLIPAIRTFLVWFVPTTVLIHAAGSALHEGPPFGSSLRRRLTACAICGPLGAVAFFWAAVLCGVSASEQGWATLHWAALMSSFLAVPVAANIALDGARWQYVFAHWQPSGTDELSAAVPGFAAALGAFVGAFPTPLDWGTEWQVWPVSSGLAAGTGYAIGLVTAVGAALYSRRSQRGEQRTETEWDD